MRDTMLRQQRDTALFRAYQEALGACTFSNQREAVDYVRLHSAPRWFVSKEFCAAVISSRIRGRDHYKMGVSKKRKFDALYKLYLKMKGEDEYKDLCLLAVCEIMVETPAPEWFLGYQAASRIIQEQINRRNERVAMRYGRK